MSVVFEFDPEKSVANLAKHGIDFDLARQIWTDPGKVIVPSNYPNERRWIATGLIGEKPWSAIFTYREQNIRLISVRRARTTEVKTYEQSKD